MGGWRVRRLRVWIPGNSAFEMDTKPGNAKDHVGYDDQLCISDFYTIFIFSHYSYLVRWHRFDFFSGSLTRV